MEGQENQVRPFLGYVREKLTKSKLFLRRYFESLTRRHHLNAQQDNDKPLNEVFTLFSKLPTELRLAIYQQAIEDVGPRDVHFDDYWGMIPTQFGIQSPNIPTTLLHTCIESRVEALRRYKYLNPIRSGPHGGPSGFFDFCRDTLDFGVHSPTPAVYHEWTGIWRGDYGYIYNFGRCHLHGFSTNGLEEERMAIKFLRRMRPREIEDPDNREGRLSVMDHLTSFGGLRHIVFLQDDVPFNPEWKTIIETAIARRKAEDSTWVAPTWEFEVLGAKDRVSSTIQAL